MQKYKQTFPSCKLLLSNMVYHTSEPLKQVFGGNHLQQTAKAKQWLPVEFMDSCETESSGLTHYWEEESYFLQHANTFSGTSQLRLFSLLYVISWELPLYSTCQLKLYLWICTLVTPCPNVHLKETKLVTGKVEMQIRLSTKTLKLQLLKMKGELIKLDLHSCECHTLREKCIFNIAWLQRLVQTMCLTCQTCLISDYLSQHSMKGRNLILAFRKVGDPREIIISAKNSRFIN